MTIMVENVHLQRGSVEVKDKQVPFEGNLLARVNDKQGDGINLTALLEDSGVQKSEGQLLFSALTGGRLVKKKLTRPFLAPLKDQARNLGKTSRKINEIEMDEKKDVDKKIEYCEGPITMRSGFTVLLPHALYQNLAGVSDISVDTSDLLKKLQDQAEARHTPEPKTAWLFDRIEDREAYDRANEAVMAIETIKLQDYLKTIIEAKEKIQARTDILDGLKLAEDVEELDGAEVKPKSAGALVGAMCATSIVIKHARRLAGLMDAETRVVNLRDVGIFLAKLAATAAVKDENIELPDLPKIKSEIKADWRLPLSPEVAVMYAQDDLRKGLGMESRTERFIKRRKGEIAAAKRAAEFKAKQMAEEKQMQDYFASLEGTAGDVGDGDGGGFYEGDRDGGVDYGLRQYGRASQISFLQPASSNENDSPCSREEPSSCDDGTRRERNDRRRGRRGRGGRYGGETSVVRFSKDLNMSYSPRLVRLSGSSSKGEDGGWGGEECMLPLESATTAGISESEEISAWRGGVEKTLRSIGVQTDSEMESASKTCDEVQDYAALLTAQQPHVDVDDEAAELARMRREMIKLKRQLRFWRARSWVTQHRALLATKPAKTVTRSLTDADLRTMPSPNEPDAIMVPVRISSGQVPKLSLRPLEQQNQTPLANIHLMYARTVSSGSKSGLSQQYTPWSGRTPQSGCASPRLTLKQLGDVGKSPSQTPRLPSLEPMKRMLSPLRPVRED